MQKWFLQNKWTCDWWLCKTTESLFFGGWGWGRARAGLRKQMHIVVNICWLPCRVCCWIPSGFQRNETRRQPAALDESCISFVFAALYRMSLQIIAGIIFVVADNRAFENASDASTPFSCCAAVVGTDLHRAMHSGFVGCVTRWFLIFFWVQTVESLTSRVCWPEMFQISLLA